MRTPPEALGCSWHRVMLQHKHQPPAKLPVPLALGGFREPGGSCCCWGPALSVRFFCEQLGFPSAVHSQSIRLGRKPQKQRRQREPLNVLVVQFFHNFNTGNSRGQGGAAVTVAGPGSIVPTGQCSLGCDPPCPDPLQV